MFEHAKGNGRKKGAKGAKRRWGNLTRRRGRRRGRRTGQGVFTGGNGVNEEGGAKDIVGAISDSFPAVLCSQVTPVKRIPGFPSVTLVAVQSRIYGRGP
jgi:hypothetical protein